MKSVLLIGLGLFGRHIAKELSALRHEVLAIDTDEAKVNAVMSYVTAAQIGDCTDEGYLSTLGISSFDLCIVAVGDDFQSSLEITSMLKEMGAKYVVSRAATDIHEKFLLRNGADKVIYPEKQLAHWASVRYTSNHLFDYIEIDEEHSIFELSVPDEWIGKTVIELDVRKKYGINILGIKQNGSLSVGIKPDMHFDRDMTVLVLGDIKDVKKHFKL